MGEGEMLVLMTVATRRKNGDLEFSFTSSETAEIRHYTASDIQFSFAASSIITWSNRS